VKDIFRVDGLPTRAGSDLPAAALAGPEAAVVSALKDAGAIVLGKTVTTEFAYYDPGPTRNPHDPDHTPGGSSSGSAAAVAAGLCPLALGTQTVGSTMRPAAFCGIVGFKPSLDRIPLDGVIPFSYSADHVGLFTQDVAGMRRAAGVVCPAWEPTEVGTPTLGVPADPYLEQATDAGLAAFEQQVNRLKAAGYDVRRVDVLSDIESINERHTDLITAEAALVHGEWYDAYTDSYREHMVELLEDGNEITAGRIAESRASQGELRERLAERMTATGVDLWISPAAPGPAPEGIDDTGDPVMNVPWTHSGVPTVSLPAGEVDGLPVGLQVAARFGADERLLAWSSELLEAL
jgi:Asp-tRNA(Asn)/Glu-tRNA(Gln) amidotransferase A subunit family amidase